MEVQVIGHFGNGRIEEFLDCKTLDSTDAALPVLAKRIAKKLNEFHNITVPEEKRPMLFHTLRSMLATARSITFADTLKQKTLDGINLDSLENDITEMENICKAMGSPTVYSHNDLLPGNSFTIHSKFSHGKEFRKLLTCVSVSLGNIVLLRDKETGEACLENSTMNFIDFEYSSYSYRGFDIGNHFNEYAGFDCDWSLYPAEDQQRLFIAAYLDIEPSAEQESLERLVVEANFFSLLSNMLWGCWSIVQAKYSPIDFDYLAYCINRLDEYYRQKPKRVEAVKSLLLTNGHV